MKKILVIENETPVRENIMELLSAESYSPTGAKDGEEGVRFAREYLPDLILCDIMMPNLDGYGVLATLKKETRTMMIPFIFLTALQDRSDMRRGMGLGSDDFVTKPFTREELLETVQVSLEKHQVIIDQVKRKMLDLKQNIYQSMPHELLTPLSVVLGFSELIIDGQDKLLPSQISEMAEDIHNAGLSLMRLIQNQMLLTELEMINADLKIIEELRNNKVPSAGVVISEISWLKARQEGREAQFHVSIEAASLRISETYLQKIVEELLDNAFRYSSIGSHVSIIGIRENDQYGNYRLEVTDNGQGMSLNQIRAVELGQQDTQSKYDQHGIGIGLLIVKRIVDIYGGTLNITSAPGKGTSVEIKLKT